MEATKIIQVVLVILALALIGGAAAGLLGVFDDDGGSSSGGGGGSGGGSSNTETTAPDDTAVTETYVASDGDPTCSHTMDDGKVVTAATCGAEGTKVFTCTKCGYTEEEKISKTNEHTYALKTYTNNEHMKYCTVCNGSTLYEEHTFTESIREATCTTTGSYIYSCPCGYKTTEIIPSLGHLVTTWIESGDSHKGICTRTGCGESVTETHAYGSTVTVEATCTTSGSNTQTCELCGARKVSTIPILAHNYVLTSTESATCSSSGTKYYECSREGCTATKTESIGILGHSYKLTSTDEATCTASGVEYYECSRSGCSATKTETIDALGHNYTLKSTVAATCGATGSKTYECSRCESSYTETIEATGNHSYDILSSTSATCTENGHTRLQCEVCGATKTEVEYATGHTYVIYSTDVDADGRKIFYKRCSSCGDEIVS